MWSILLAILATTSGVVAAYMVIPQVSDSAQAIRDYSLSSSSPTMTVSQGSSATTTITVTSLNGFDLATGLGTTISGSGLSASLSPTIVTPSMGGKATSVLTVNASPSTPPGSYSITVSSSGGTKTHSTTISVTVAAADFAIATPVYPLQIQQGSVNATTVTFTALGTFSGTVLLSASTAFGSGIAVTGSPSSLILATGTSAVSTLTVYALSSATVNSTYTVTVIGSSGTITHSTNIPVKIVQGGIVTGRESLNLESFAFTSNTHVTLYIRNTGSASVSLVGYYVKDSSGNQWALISWSGPTIAVNAVANTVINIGTSCSSCTYSGTSGGFTQFIAGYSYTITIITARNNQFTFSVTR